MRRRAKHSSEHRIAVIRCRSPRRSPDPSNAKCLKRAHCAAPDMNGQLDAHVLDLAYYELGDVLIRASGWTAQDVADQLDDLTSILGPPLVNCWPPAWPKRRPTSPPDSLCPPPDTKAVARVRIPSGLPTPAVQTRSASPPDVGQQHRVAPRNHDAPSFKRSGRAQHLRAAS